MSILTWLKEVTSGGSAEFIDTNGMTFAKGEEQFHGLDMKAALDIHMGWTHRLQGKLTGHNPEHLDVATVASDCECTLGKWIHGSAKEQFGGLPEYHQLRQTHAEFHLKAGEILNNVVNGECEVAKSNLKELRFQSGNVQLALVRLYSQAQ
jgi:hypothetical protein